MAACCSYVVAVPSSQVRRLFAADFSSIAVATSIRVTPPQRFPSNGRRLYALQRRRITPRVEATRKTFSSFDDLLENSDKPVLADFYATWCGPCQFMVPILDQVGEKLKDKIQIVKIDTEKYTKIANRYKIEALPTLIVFRDGKPCDRLEGALSTEQLIQWVENALKIPE